MSNIDNEWGQEPITIENRYLPNPNTKRPWPRQNRGKNPEPVRTMLKDEQDFIGWAKWLIEVDPYTWEGLEDMTDVEFDEASIGHLYRIMCHLADGTEVKSMEDEDE